MQQYEKTIQQECCHKRKKERRKEREKEREDRKDRENKPQKVHYKKNIYTCSLVVCILPTLQYGN